MNYKDTISSFRSRFETEQFNREQRLRKLTDRQIMFELSAIQSYLQNTYKLYDKAYSLTTAIGQSSYIVGTGATTIPNDVLDIKNVKVLNGTSYRNLTPISKEQINIIDKNCELSSYAVYGQGSSMILEIDFVPTEAGTLFIQYVPRLELFDSTAGQATNKTFSDTNYVESTMLGEWLIPKDWHLLLIDGALSNYFPDKKQEWYSLCDDKHGRRMETISLTLPSHLGTDA